MRASENIKNDRRIYTPDNVDRLYIIRSHRDYAVTSEGAVFHLPDKTPVKWILRHYPGDYIIPSVIIDNEEYSIPKILCETFIGNFPAAKGYTLAPGGEWYRAKDVAYAYDKLVIVDDNEIQIDGISFKNPGTPFNQYRVSEDGTIFNITTRDFAHIRENTQHYLYLYAYTKDSCDNAKKIYVAVHRLVYMAWIGPIPEGVTVDHIDSDFFHNHYTNLQLLSRAANAAKAYSDGGNTKNLKWTKEQVKQICELMTLRYRKGQIATMIGVPNDESFKRLIGRLRQALRHKDIVNVYNDVKMYEENTVFDHDTIISIAKLMQDEGVYDEKEICQRIGLPQDKKTYNRIGQIRRKETYAKITEGYDFSGYDGNQYAWNSFIKYDTDFDHLCQMIANGRAFDEIAAEFQVNFSSRKRFASLIAAIRRGEIRPEIANKYHIIERTINSRDVSKKVSIVGDTQGGNYETVKIQN